MGGRRVADLTGYAKALIAAGCSRPAVEKDRYRYVASCSATTATPPAAAELHSDAAAPAEDET